MNSQHVISEVQVAIKMVNKCFSCHNYEL